MKKGLLFIGLLVIVGGVLLLTRKQAEKYSDEDNTKTSSTGRTGAINTEIENSDYSPTEKIVLQKMASGVKQEDLPKAEQKIVAQIAVKGRG